MIYRRSVRRMGAMLLASLTVLWSPAISFAQSVSPAGTFYLGADISALAGGGRGGASFVYRDSGQESTEYAVMLKHGWNAFRLRVFVSPVCGGDWQVTKWRFDHVTAAKIDYDIIGQSFYPKYHGALAMLQQNMIESEKRYHKPFMVVEPGYVRNDPNAMSSPEAIDKPVLSARTPKDKGFMQWPGTPQGQLQYMADVINTVQRNKGIGVFYWGPECARGDGMWNADGSPAPSIFVIDHLGDLVTRLPSRIPSAPRP